MITLSNYTSFEPAWKYASNGVKFKILKKRKNPQKQLKLDLSNPSLTEETPQQSNRLKPSDYPFDRYMLWPQQESRYYIDFDKSDLFDRNIKLARDKRLDRLVTQMTSINLSWAKRKETIYKRIEHY